MKIKSFKYSVFAVVSVCLVLFAMAFVDTKKEQADKHLEIIFRNIGHQLLLHSGDSTSRVLPVTKSGDNTFRISFENSFGFMPDTLMNVVQRQLAKTDMPDNYTVSVNDCLRTQTVFAYEINTSTGNLTPCRGRELKKGCYIIEVSFADPHTFNKAWLLTAFVPLAFFGLYLGRRQRKLNQENAAGHLKDIKPVHENGGQTSHGFSRKEDDLNLNNEKVSEHRKIGNFRFIESESTLSLNGEIIELSEKETKAMTIFSSRQNILVERELFQKAIWEDEGLVVIARNVDVLISKLRKKLSADPSIKIVNVHGKGYKMMIG